MLVVVGQQEEIISRFRLWDERYFRKANCVEWKAEPPPLWAYTYPKTVRDEDIVVALIVAGGLEEEQMEAFEKSALELLKIAKPLIEAGREKEKEFFMQKMQKWR